jgi:hypothetical protein
VSGAHATDHLGTTRGPDADGPATPASEDVHPCLRVLSCRFSQRGVRWCALEPTGASPPSGGPLPVLVHPDDLARAEHVVRSISGIVLPAVGRGHQCIWLFRDARSGSSLTLQVTTRIAASVGDERDRRLTMGVLLHRVGDVVPRIGLAERFWLDLLASSQHRPPTARELQRLRALARAAPVESSPLARTVAACIDVREDAWGILDRLHRARALPRTPGIPAFRRERTWRSHRREAEAQRCVTGMVVAVLGCQDAASAIVRDPPDWPFPVRVADARRSSEEVLASSPKRLLLDLLRFRLQGRRWRKVARSGALILVEHHPYEVLTSPALVGLKGRFARRTLLPLLPQPDAVALLLSPEATWNDGPSPAFEPSPPCPVLRLSTGGSHADVRDTLGSRLWGILRWRVITRSVAGLDGDLAATTGVEGGH